MLIMSLVGPAHVSCLYHGFMSEQMMMMMIYNE